jgi:hypothetical protein
LLILSVTIVSILGGLSAVMILTNPNNIGLDPGGMEWNLEINNTTLEIENVNFTFPFNLTNTGYFDLDHLELKLELSMNYSHVDYPVLGVNETRVVKIFNESEYLGNIPKGTTGYFNFTGLFSDFNFPPLLNFTSDIDWYRGPPAILFYVNLTISLDYSLGMHSVTIGIYDLPVGGFP